MPFVVTFLRLSKDAAFLNLWLRISLNSSGWVVDFLFGLALKSNRFATARSNRKADIMRIFTQVGESLAQFHRRFGTRGMGVWSLEVAKCWINHDVDECEPLPKTSMTTANHEWRSIYIYWFFNCCDFPLPCYFYWGGDSFVIMYLDLPGVLNWMDYKGAPPPKKKNILYGNGMVQMSLLEINDNKCLGGGFKYFICSPLPGEMIQFD